MEKITLLERELALIIALRRVSVEDLALVAKDLEGCYGYPEFMNEYKCALRDVYAGEFEVE